MCFVTVSFIIKHFSPSHPPSFPPSLSPSLPDIPLFTTPPVDTQAGHGQEAVFTCVAVGPPEPSISWQRLDGALRNGSVQSGNELHLFSVTVQDNGSYQCVTTNVYGTQAASATLTVLGESFSTCIWSNYQAPLNCFVLFNWKFFKMIDFPRE